MKLKRPDGISDAEFAQMLADAWRNHLSFHFKYWYEAERRWVRLTNHGSADTRCGSPVPTPRTDEIKPHQREMWKACWKCKSIKPLGGCGSKFPEPKWAWSKLVPADKTPVEKPKPELTEVDSPAEILAVLEAMTDCAAFGEWIAEDEIASFATQQFDYKINVNSLLKLLRLLWREGKIEHKRYADGKNTFRLTVQEK